MKEKIVLAYSGGLDTSVAITWLKENYDLDVIAVAVSLGGGEDMTEAIERATRNGAIEAYGVDAAEEFAAEYLSRAIKANALYEDKYPLATALGRPLIVKHLVEQAKKSGATAVAHGCTGKGNDQVRFDVGIATLAPELKIIAPIREWKMSREEEIDYAAEHDIEIKVDKTKVYSIDANIWGGAIEGGVLEEPWNEPPDDIYHMTRAIAATPAEAAYAELTFASGVPAALNGRAMSLKDIVVALNELAGEHGVGRLDMVENRLVGIKSREIYEAPAAVSIIEAHRALEDLTLERHVMHYKRQAEQKYAELVYNGQWFSPLREALDAFFNSLQANVNGDVRLRFNKGNLAVVGRRSPQSLYQYELATYDKSDEFRHEAAEGFIELYGLPLTHWAKKHKENS
jgi:argininosuccinate synthase